MHSANELSAVQWRKSTYSTNGGDCIELGEGIPGAAPIRDSKDPEGPALFFGLDAFAAFVTAVKQGEFPAA